MSGSGEVLDYTKDQNRRDTRRKARHRPRDTLGSWEGRTGTRESGTRYLNDVGLGVGEKDRSEVLLDWLVPRDTPEDRNHSHRDGPRETRDQDKSTDMHKYLCNRCTVIHTEHEGPSQSLILNGGSFRFREVKSTLHVTVKRECLDPTHRN